MLDCLIMGDSIAVGTAQFRKECAVIAKTGINSTDWRKRHLSSVPDAKTTIISLGTNDWDKLTSKNLLDIRNKIQGKVYWILPSPTRKSQERQAVIEIANEFHDMVIDRPKEMSADGIHPTSKGYRELAEKTK
jgi:lysophospholipase L1-like esterase